MTVLFINLVKNYVAIIPPTIARKKHKSAHTVLIRKKTALVDIWMVQGKLSISPLTREGHIAQQVEQKAAATVPPIPQVLSPPPTQ